MSIFSELTEIENKHNIRLHWGEPFKQAVYNDRMTDPISFIIDKIELTIKHHPSIKNFGLTINESDFTSPEYFCYAVVTPYPE